MPPFLAPLAVFVIFIQEMWQIVKQPQYRSLIYWIILLIGVGTVFFARVEGWGILDSLYFSVMTLTTVGYGDFTPTTESGKLFTVFYVLVGMGILASFLNMLARERRTILQSRLGQEGKSESES